MFWLDLAAFVLALLVNGTINVGENAEAASRLAVARGGMNPSVWGFGIWGVIYALFGCAYAGRFATSRLAFPLALSVSWAANASWLIASTSNAWRTALGFMVLYVAATLHALPVLCDSASAPLRLASVGATLLITWLIPATLLNVQIVAPSFAPLLGAAGPWVVILGAGLLLRWLPDEGGPWAVARRVAVVGGAAWALVALSGHTGGRRLG